MRINTFIMLMQFPTNPFVTSGVANGYVMMTRDHPWYGMHYDALPITDIHGGLTFSGEVVFNDNTYWAIGFDTGHHADTPERWPVDKVWAEAQRLLKHVDNAYSLVTPGT